MSSDQTSMLARADVALCVLLPAALVAIGDIATATRLAEAAPRILTTRDLERWHEVYVTRSEVSELGYRLHGYAYDVPEALLWAPHYFDDVIEGVEDTCREAILGLLLPES